MDRKTKIAKTFLIFTAIILLFPGVVFAAEAKITVTIAVGGAIGGGLYFFLAYSTGNFAPGFDLNQRMRQAVFTFGPDGWKTKAPIPIFIKPVGEKIFSPYMELVRIRF